MIELSLPCQYGQFTLSNVPVLYNNLTQHVKTQRCKELANVEVTK